MTEHLDEQPSSFIFIITGNYLKLCYLKPAKLRNAGLYSAFA